MKLRGIIRSFLCLILIFLICFYNHIKEDYVENKTSIKIVNNKYYENKINNFDSETYVLKGVKVFNQYPKYKSGCEVVSLHILLDYYGIKTNIDDLINNLNKTDLPYEIDGENYSKDPQKYFIGDPYNSNSYGTFALTIFKLSQKYTSKIENISGNSLDYILNIVKEGNPVQVWISKDLKEPVQTINWIDDETNKEISWYQNEHSLIIVGFNKDSIIVSDPQTGKIKYFNRNLFEERYNFFNKQALYYHE